MTASALRTVVVVGGGGREHALAWKLSQSPSVGRLIVAPGNDGMPNTWERWPLENFGGFAKRCREEKVDLVVVGPETHLAEGIVDALSLADVLVFGPRAEAAQVESSKAFAKDVMRAAKVPTARFQTVRSIDEARKFLTSEPWGAGWVVKADGLALGKGVVVADSREEALRAAESLISVSGSLVIEERLVGEELSWLALCDGERCVMLDPARDHKRVGDGDTGPNTGGMGAFSPVPGLPASLGDRVRREVILPALAELKKRGCEFRGVLYAGLMVDFVSDRFWVIEFNARFGDPETQVLMPRIEGDIYPWFEACALGALDEMPQRIPFSKDYAVVIVGAARGYPESPEKGQPIQGLTPEAVARGEYFLAGVRRDGQRLLTNGGRVFGATGRGATLHDARVEAYERIEQVSFQGMHYREDIGGASL